VAEASKLVRQNKSGNLCGERFMPETGKLPACCGRAYKKVGERKLADGPRVMRIKTFWDQIGMTLRLPSRRRDTGEDAC